MHILGELWWMSVLNRLTSAAETPGAACVSICLSVCVSVENGIRYKLSICRERGDSIYNAHKHRGGYLQVKCNGFLSSAL